MVTGVGGSAMTKGVAQISEGKRGEKDGRKEVPGLMCGPCAAKSSMQSSVGGRWEFRVEPKRKVKAVNTDLEVHRIWQVVGYW